MDDPTATALLDLAEDAAPRLLGPDAAASVDRLEREDAELRSAMAWFVDEGRPDSGLRLANALYRFWITTRRFEDGATAFDLVLRSGAGDDRLRGRAFLNAGFMPFWLGDDHRAATLFDAALGMGRRLDEPTLVSGALGGLARIALRTDVAEGRRLAAEALEVSEAAGDEPGISNALHLLGVGAQIAGDLPEAREWMTRRLKLARAEGNEFVVASEASNLSMVERQLGDLDTAEALAREVLEIGRADGRAVHHAIRDQRPGGDRDRAWRPRAWRDADRGRRSHDGGVADGVAAGRAAPLRADARDARRGDGTGCVRARTSYGTCDELRRRGRLCASW